MEQFTSFCNMMNLYDLGFKLTDQHHIMANFVFDYAYNVASFSIILVYLVTRSKKLLASAFLVTYTIICCKLVAETCKTFEEEKITCITQKYESFGSMLWLLFSTNKTLLTPDEIENCSARTYSRLKLNILEIVLKSLLRACQMFVTFSLSCLLNCILALQHNSRI